MFESTVKGALLLTIALLGGCTSSLKDFSSHVANAKGHTGVLQTAPFPVLAAFNAAQKNARTLRVYLEDDGSAAVESGSVSNPTPSKPMLVNIALADPTPSVYLARPCQYVWNSRCTPLQWSERRFSASVINSYQQALEFLKPIHHNQTFELVGYGGGGTLALLLAATRTDVIRVQTLAGNLAPATWSRLHNLAPLTGSVDPLKFADKLKIIPQRHLVGHDDTEVPRAVAQAYLLALPDADCLTVTVVDADHAQGWEAAWGTFRDQPISCRAPDFAAPLTDEPGTDFPQAYGFE